jgi:6-phosphogluconolactonase (cycloisomerase 2 family)
MLFLTGGYTADMDGAATGIGMLVAGAADAVLAGGPLGFAGDAVGTGGSPSWLAAHPTLDVVYAALEGSGGVQAFRRTGESSYARLGEPVTAGALVCHVAVAPDGASLVAACWGDGRVVRMALDAVGRPSAPSIAPAAVDPYGEPDPLADADRALLAGAVDLSSPRGDRPAGDAAAEDQAGDPDARVSRAHAAAFLPGGRVATTDMGLDLVRFWRAAGSALRPVGEVVLPRGSGPRHLLWHPSGHLFVVTELSCELFALAPDAAGSWRIVAGTQLSPAVLDGDTAAELTASRDGEVLYAGVRGSNTIAVVRVRGDGAQLQPLALVEAGVNWPRHHVVVRDTLLAAGQRSDDVASHTLDLRTGVPSRVRHRTAVPSPTCLLPIR